MPPRKSPKSQVAIKPLIPPARPAFIACPHHLPVGVLGFLVLSLPSQIVTFFYHLSLQRSARVRKPTPSTKPSRSCDGSRLRLFDIPTHSHRIYHYKYWTLTSAATAPHSIGTKINKIVKPTKTISAIRVSFGCYLLLLLQKCMNEPNHATLPKLPCTFALQQQQLASRLVSSRPRSAG
ncbi:hypothetical protein B0T09DRAFT_99936 [Sordaria sp. MPI-SDFR-AT-0083]|nr:hypothetical protein B0T09DRAFT_99936 [Sordaria sp. MPI-SDFR-AT-0083]